jgi:hypothetical protein
VDETWGISGPRFLVVYAVLLVLAYLAVVLGRRVLARPPAAMPIAPGELDAYEVAMLSDGEWHAVTTAVIQLNHAGVLVVGGDPPTVSPGGPLPVGAHPVERAVYECAAAEGGSAAVALAEAERTALRDRFVQRGRLVDPEQARRARILVVLAEAERTRRALAALRERLVQRGLLVGPEQARRARLLVALPVAVLLFGLARLAAGLANDKPVGDLVLLLVATAATLWYVWLPLPLTTEGSAALQRLRRETKTNGAATPAALVAVLGASALWGLNAGLAGALGVPRLPGSGDGGGGGCGGGGCGGGGCGG